MGTLLTLVLTNKYILASVTCLIGAFAFWFKGYNQGKKSIERQDALSQIELNRQIQQTEAQNQATDQKREQTNDAINSSSNSIPQLISLWNSLFQKTPSNKTGKDS